MEQGEDNSMTMMMNHFLVSHGREDQRVLHAYLKKPRWLQWCYICIPCGNDTNLKTHMHGSVFFMICAIIIVDLSVSSSCISMFFNGNNSHQPHVRSYNMDIYVYHNVSAVLCQQGRPREGIVYNKILALIGRIVMAQKCKCCFWV